LAIATGLSKRAIAQRFDVSPDAVWRHSQAHLTAEIRSALATKLLRREGDLRRILLEEGTAVTEVLKAIRGPLFGLFLVAIDAGDSKAAAALAGRLHESLALSAKLTGELVPHAGVSITNVLLSPDFMRLRGELLQVLQRYPQARDEAAAVFRWPSFTRFLDDGRICLTNNAAERALRGIAIARSFCPYSGRRSRSIIAGMHSMGAAFAANMSSDAPAAMSFMSR
jgi:transposase IS66 family protein